MLKLLGLIAMSIVPAAASAQDTPLGTADEAAVRTIVESVGALADRGDFTALERLFADEVAFDYSSLSGEPADVRSPQAIMTAWAGVLPGFDRTRHELSNIAVEVAGAEATATADVRAGHWMVDAYWEVVGAYEYRLAREEWDWAITAMTFTLVSETGSRDVFGPAIEAAAANPADYLVRQHTREAVLAFLTGLEDKDMERVNGVWAEDAVQEMHFAPDGFPNRVSGREALIAHYAGWPDNAGDANFTDELVFYTTLDSRITIAEFHGVSHIRPTGRVYDQRYIGVFHVEGGKITLFREYFDPAAFRYAFGLDEGGAFFRE